MFNAREKTRSESCHAITRCKMLAIIYDFSESRDNGTLKTASKNSCISIFTFLLCKYS